CLQYTSASFTF
nr:immunoglobulin light chain junction region [Macaca mulatta]